MDHIVVIKGGTGYDLTKKVAHDIELSMRFMGIPGTRIPGTEGIDTWKTAAIALKTLGLPYVEYRNE